MCKHENNRESHPIANKACKITREFGSNLELGEETETTKAKSEED